MFFYLTNFGSAGLQSVGKRGITFLPTRVFNTWNQSEGGLSRKEISAQTEFAVQSRTFSATRHWSSFS